jgi:hypothetical protein
MNEIALWNGGADFQKKCAQFIGQPFLKPWLHHEHINPVHKMISIFGRAGQHKARAVEAYCSSVGVQYTRISVELGNTTMAVELMEHFFNSLQPNPAVHYSHILILEHANLLLTSPDSDVTTQFMEDLKKMTQELPVLIVALFDSNPLNPAEQIPAPAKSYRKLVMSYFTIRIYYACPPHTYTVPLLKSLLHSGVEYYSETLPEGKRLDMRIDLTEGNYANMETYTSFCTPRDILWYVNRIFCDLVTPGMESPFARPQGVTTGPLTINFDVLCQYLTSHTGSRHVLRYDARYEEDEYSVLCGNGPIPGVHRKREDQMEAIQKKKKPTPTMVIEEEEEEVKEPKEKKSKVAQVWNAE